MEKKKWLKVVGIFLLVLLVLTLVEKGLRALQEKTIQAEKEEEKSQNVEKILFPQQDVVQAKITDFLDVIFDALQDEDYNYVYRYLDETYREYQFQNDVQQLETFVKENIFPLPLNKEIASIGLAGGYYQVVLKGDESGEKENQFYTIKIHEDDTCSFMWGRFRSLRKVKNTILTTANLRYHVTYYYETNSLLGYVIEATNTSHEDVTLQFTKQPVAITGGGKTLKGHLPDDVTIRPNETIRTEFIFSLLLRKAAMLKFETSENGTVQEHVIPLVSDNLVE